MRYSWWKCRPSCLFSFFQQQIADQIANIPVPRGRGVQAVEVFKVLSQNRIQQRRLPSRLFTLQFAIPDPGVAAPSAVSREELEQVVFRILTQVKKKFGGRREFECEGTRSLELIHAGGLWPGRAG